MLNEETMEGLYCSRDFAEWMLKKNRETMDYPVSSYQQLVRLFCRPNYREFLDEEARKGNEFFYRLVLSNGEIRLERSYELVFLPYEELISETEPQTAEEFLLGYRILQTRGCLPGNPLDIFRYTGWSTMKYIVDEIKIRAESWEKFAAKNRISIEKILDRADTDTDGRLGYNYMSDRKYYDTYKLSEFERTVQRGFIDNEYPFSVGPSCPDRTICFISYWNILRHMMADIDELGLVPEKGHNAYELRVAAYTAAIFSFIDNGKPFPENGLSVKMLERKAEEIFDHYNKKLSGSTEELCRRIRIGLLWTVTVFMDHKKRSCSDYDYEDWREAPIGLTKEDRESFDRVSFSEDITCTDEDGNPLSLEDLDCYYDPDYDIGCEEETDDYEEEYRRLS